MEDTAEKIESTGLCRIDSSFYATIFDRVPACGFIGEGGLQKYAESWVVRGSATKARDRKP
jgi:hypothetical protein